MTRTQTQGADGAGTFDHEFKSHPDVFWPAARGEKTFEYRRDDRGGYEIGQTVRLRCYGPLTGYMDVPPLDRRITNILRGGDFELPKGFCILSLAPLADGAGTKTAAALLPLDDPNRPLNDSGLPSAMIWAGGEAYDDLTAINGGRQLDLDSCSLAVGIYRAMTEAHAKKIATLSPAPAATPGVPDSLRALSEAATQGVLNVSNIADGWQHTICAGPTWRVIAQFERAEDAEFFAAAGTHVRTLIAAQPAGQSEPPALRAVVEVYPDRTDTRLTFGGRIRPEPGVKAVQQAIAALTAEYEARGGCPVVGRHPAGQSAGQGELIRSLQIELSIAQGANRALKEWIKGYRIKGRFQALGQLPAGQVSGDRGEPDPEAEAYANAAMISSQPAGQAGDAGAVKRLTRTELEPHITSLILWLMERGGLGQWAADIAAKRLLLSEDSPLCLKPAPNSTRTGAAEDLSAVRQAFERALPHSVKRFGEIAERFKPAPNSTRTGAAETGAREIIPFKANYRHKKTGGLYQTLDVVTNGTNGETNGQNMVLYTNGMKSFVREYSEFFDGRFERIQPEAALAARPEAPSDAGWRPIAEAKHDGTVYLLGFYNGAEKTAELWCAVEGWYETGIADRCWYDVFNNRIEPAYFRERITPPSDPAPSGQAEG